jgi:hypothetical protein
MLSPYISMVYQKTVLYCQQKGLSTVSAPAASRTPATAESISGIIVAALAAALTLTPATFAVAAGTLAKSCSRSLTARARSITFWHNMSPFRWMVASVSPVAFTPRIRCRMPVSAATTGHGKRRMGQGVIEAGLDHVMNISGDKRDQTDAMRRYHSRQRSRNRTTNQGVDVKLYQLVDPGKQIVLRQHHFFLRKNVLMGGFQHQKRAGNIKYRCNPAIPAG